MKKTLLFSLFIGSFGTMLQANDSKFIKNETIAVMSYSTETFRVYGNCGMCKKTIESSLKDIDGIKKASWNVVSKQMTVTFNPERISLIQIKEKIATVGYDTEDVKAETSTYDKLPGCCQYDRAK